MPDLALYYPYIHVRDDAWLKAAALHWPKLARLLPHGYQAEDSYVARALNDEMAFLVDIDPGGHVGHVADDFWDLLDEDLDVLRTRYRLPSEPPGDLASNAQSGVDYSSGGVDSASSRPAYIHLSKVPPSLVRRLVAADLARTGIGRQGYTWIQMHKDLTAVYMTHLADQVARSNDMSVVTDQPGLHGLLNGWRTKRLAEVLLDGDFRPSAGAGDAEQLEETYAVLAIRTYVPANLATVPVERIVKAREVLLPEFHAFRDHLESLHGHFAEIAQVQDPNVREAKLQILLESKVRVPGADLEQTLRKLGFEPAQAVLSAKTPALPAVVSALGVPALVAHGAMVAGGFVSAVVAGERAASAERRNAHGYLLGLREELDPRGVVDRLRRTFRRLQRR
jgi:hypothetical protein